MSLPNDPTQRKSIPLASGCLDYFPDALAAVAQCSQVGNDQHNPGKPLHWDRAKSGDEADALLRHLMQRGTIDSDGVRHSTKVAWRALALLQKELEAAGGTAWPRGAWKPRSGDEPSRKGGLGGYEYAVAMAIAPFMCQKNFSTPTRVDGSHFNCCTCDACRYDGSHLARRMYPATNTGD